MRRSPGRERTTAYYFSLLSVWGQAFRLAIKSALAPAHAGAASNPVAGSPEPIAGKADSRYAQGSGLTCALGNPADPGAPGCATQREAIRQKAGEYLNLLPLRHLPCACAAARGPCRQGGSLWASRHSHVSVADKPGAASRP